MSLKPRVVAVAFAVFAAVAGSVTVFEGRRYVPYADTGGVLTVCDGITGADVVAGKRYTDKECDAMLSQRLVGIAAEISKCVTVEMDADEWRAYLDLAYNVGTPAFCRSTIVKLRNAGDRAGACAQISRWTFVAGQDCRLTGSRCPGIVKRRDYERALCEGRGLVKEPTR